MFASRSPLKWAGPLALTALFSPMTLAADESIPARSGDLSEYAYPYPAKTFDFESQRTPVEMAYMDVSPESPSGKVALLLHGKNFCASYWAPVIEHLTDQGYRVIAPDQIGFCKSSKPEGYQYSLAQLAHNTHALLETLDVDDVTLVGHSMGGMLSMRYALMYPDTLERMILINPIGLEDWTAKGVPYQPLDTWYDFTQKTDFERIKAYQKKNYFGGQWNDAFATQARLQAGMYKGPDRDSVAWASAKTYDMLMTQPVVDELPRIEVPTTLIIGQADTTAVGKNFAPEAVKKTLGDYPTLGRQAAEAIPDATLIPLEGLGHLPQTQAPETFYPAFDRALTE
ncbi:alpha/beta fold hydrolase [Larsenimonas suaedae]|uniref:Alpha/beta hydrolase n=1 Tax=Larsenimonas suaedae TaxID=1851019 RepID=A0ABU1GRF2_9GAMM|nr:alpha/beta hydrolase [Larsenimonas suaedae]MCM2972603.1 alpha/beta hydrolase [Larsenimonas suaedae]MDR5894601.1 alpha/beta hydrolase [Larsenimonas suaedae]